MLEPLTRDKLLPFKRNVLLYRHTHYTDRYNNVIEDYITPPETIESVMITPYQYAARFQFNVPDLKEYGEFDDTKCQFVYYGDVKINKMDKIKDGNTEYKVLAVLEYNTHVVVKLEEVLNE